MVAASQIVSVTDTERVSESRNMEALLADDWSFASLSRSETLWGPHGYHRYPAKFIPQLVRRLVELYSSPGDLVGDTFVGSATTGIEAIRTRRRFWGSDLNPVALLISQAKCTPLPPPELSAIWQEIDTQLNRIMRLGRRPLTEEEEATIRSINIAHATEEETFAYWFPVQHRAVLDAILGEVLNIGNIAIRIFFLCAFSNILRRTSIWLSGSTKPQKDLKKTLPDPVEEFRKQVRDMIKRNLLYWDNLCAANLDPSTVAERCQLIHADARSLPLRDGALDFLVSSPPYATCYEYNDLHRLSELWFTRYGIIPTEHRRMPLIGSSILSHRMKAQSSRDLDRTGSPIADAALDQLASQAFGDKATDIRGEVRQLRYYFQDMLTVLHESARIIAPGKRMVLIVGDSRRRGITIPTSSAICQMAGDVGFMLEHRIIRQVPARVLTSTREETTGRFSSTARSTSRAYPNEDILVFLREL